MTSLYYGAWANLADLPLLGRAAIVIAIPLLLLWFIARPIAARILSYIFRIVDWLLKKSFLLWEKLLSCTIAVKDPDGYAERYNRTAGRFEKVSQRLSGWALRLTGKRRTRVGTLLIIYGILTALIALPDILSPVVSNDYISYFSLAKDFYQKLEAPMLQKAVAYVPLIDISKEAQGKEENETDPKVVESPEEEIWLFLSKRGRGGSNVRAEPGEQSKVLTAISGDISLLYLGDQDGLKNSGWVHVRLPDGTEGWIYGNLVTEIP